MSTTRFEYTIGAAQEGRITFENDDWQGAVPATGDPKAALESCPKLADWLNQKGSAGWELVAVVRNKTADTFIEKLYLKRSR